ncbi:hypothetical protein D3C87_298720 [compost metagenome]
MKNYDIISAINISLFAVPFITALSRYKRLDKGMQILCISCGVSLLSEILALYAAFQFHNNIPVYTIYSVVDTILLCLYFDYSIAYFHKRYIGKWLTLLTILSAIGSLIYLGSLDSINNFFLYYQGIIIITMCLFALIQQLYRSEYRLPEFSPHFWAAILFIFCWTLALMNVWLYEFLNDKPGILQSISNYMMVWISMLMNIGLTIIFLSNPKNMKYAQ